MFNDRVLSYCHLLKNCHQIEFMYVSLEKVSILLGAGTDPSIKNTEVKTALDLCKEEEFQDWEVVCLLEEAEEKATE